MANIRHRRNNWEPVVNEDAFSKSVPGRFHYLKEVAEVFGLTLLAASDIENDRWQTLFDAGQEFARKVRGDRGSGP